MSMAAQELNRLFKDVYEDHDPLEASEHFACCGGETMADHVYAKDKALVDPKYRDLLPDPNSVPHFTVTLNESGTIERNYLGEIVRDTSGAAIFEKAYVTVDGVERVTWLQRGWNPMNDPKARAEFAKEAFGLSDEELVAILAKASGAAD